MFLYLCTNFYSTIININAIFLTVIYFGIFNCNSIIHLNQTVYFFVIFKFFVIINVYCVLNAINVLLMLLLFV